MEERESRICLWFEMWLMQQDLGMEAIFAENVVYTESWGPEYHGRKAVKHWFQEWNTRGRVTTWDIKQFFHKKDQTVVEWNFKNEMKDGTVEAFEGMSLIIWTADNRIKGLKEFGCNLDRYDPYAHGKEPVFREERAAWF